MHQINNLKMWFVVEEVCLRHLHFLSIYQTCNLTDNGKHSVSEPISESLMKLRVVFPSFLQKDVLMAGGQTQSENVYHTNNYGISLLHKQQDLPFTTVSNSFQQWLRFWMHKQLASPHHLA